MTDHIPSWAVPGARVVCVKNLRGNGYGTEQVPEINKVYTVRELTSQDCLRVKEIVNPLCRYAEGDLEAAFKIHCFRPAVEPKTEAEDFAKFAHHLRTPASILERLDVLAERLNL
jgi:hypothetical protein